MSEGPARVVEALRQADGPCSGERLSRDLGVTRAQVWKHVQALRSRGYAIEGERGGGYRLLSAPDRLYAEEIAAGLDTKWLARSFEHYDEIDSTNRIAMERGRAGAEHGHTIVAEAQSAGRGRLGRSFFSPANQNLYTSIVLRPAIAIAEAPTLIPTTAIAVADAIAAELGEPDAVEIKWPNDVLLAGKKASGILMEMASEGTQVGFVVLGIGVNLNVEPESFPDDFRALATSLRSHCRRQIDRPAFARRLYSMLEQALETHSSRGFGALRSRYDAYFRMPGRRVRVTERDGSQFEGTAVGIDHGGALELERDDGSVTRVLAGDVTLAKESPST